MQRLQKQKADIESALSFCGGEMDSPASRALPRLRSTRPERVDASAARPKAAAQDGPRNPPLASILQNKKADIESAFSFFCLKRGIPLRYRRCRAVVSHPPCNPDNQTSPPRTRH